MRTTIKDIWERWNFAFGLLLLAPLLVAVALKPGNEDKRQTIIVPERETLSGIFTIDVFAPFDLDALYDSKPPWSEDRAWASLEERYGKPKDTHRSSTSHSRVLQRYWDGQYGVVALCEFQTAEDGLERSIDLYPDSLRLENVLVAKYLTKVEPKEGDWELCIRAEDHTLFLLLELEGDAVTSISLSY